MVERENEREEKWKNQVGHATIRGWLYKWFHIGVMTVNMWQIRVAFGATAIKTNYDQSHSNRHQDGHPGSSWLCTALCWDIQEAAGSVQLCAGQISGSEASVHAVCSLFEAVLLVYASNAFNSLNHLSAPHNIRRLCPPLATVLINCYRVPTELFIDGDVLHSSEGTT